MKREQEQAIFQDLEKKMVLLAGPRQVGKTTLAKEIGKKFKKTTYLNYDQLMDRQTIADQAWLPDCELIILDEIHKMPLWKNYLKGLFDTKPKHQRVLVTMSARLETFNRVGDSLAGRFFLHRLLPFSPSECHKLGRPIELDMFLGRGGFPEPLFAKSELDAKRWRQQYIDSLLRVDVFDFDNIQNMNAIQLVFELLRSRVGSPISYASIARNIGISPNTVKKFIEIFEALYIVFRVTPYSKNIARSLLKEPKVYFFDAGLVKGDKVVKLENFVAVSLLKHTYAKVDYEAKAYRLHYLQTKERHEVDFALVHDDEVERLIEVKSSSRELGKGLSYFHNKYAIPSIQLVKDLPHESVQSGIELRNLERFLTDL